MTFSEGVDGRAWAFEGSAGYGENNGAVNLTQALNDEIGYLFSREPISSRRFNVSFSFSIGEGSGADGLAFVVSRSIPTGSDVRQAVGGGDFGFGVLDGFAVEFDTWPGEAEDPNLEHVGLDIMPSGEALAAKELSFSLRNNGVFDATIVFDSGHVQVYLANASIGLAETQVLDHTIPGFVPFDGFFGFVASTSSRNDRHAIYAIVFEGLTTSTPTLQPTPSPTPTPTPIPPPPAAEGSLPLIASFVGIERLPCCRVGPDAAIAAGPTSLVLVTNNVVTIRDKSGSIIDTKPAREFLDAVIPPGGNAGGDPTVVFDPHSGRFFYVAEARGGNSDCEPGACISQIVFAVSRTSSPATLGADDWYFYALDRTLELTSTGTNRTTNWGDYDHVSVSKDVVVVTWLPYSFILPAASSDFQKGARVRVINKSQLLDGDPVTTWTDFILKNRWEGTVFSPVIPAFHFGVTAPFFLIGLGEPCGFMVWGIETPLSSPTLSSRYLAGSCSDSFDPQPGDAVQPNGKWPIDNGLGMKAYPVYRDGSIWVAHAIRHDFGRGDVSAIRWVEIDVRDWPNSISFVQDAVLETNGSWNFIPSIMVDSSNNMALLFAQSSANEFPSLYYTGRLRTDPSNTLRPTALLKAGTSTVELVSNSRNRYADYFDTALDPVDGSVWMIGEYAKATDQVGVWVGNTDFDNLGAPTRSPTE